MRIGLFYQIQVPKPWTPQSESQRIHEALLQSPDVGFVAGILESSPFPLREELVKSFLNDDRTVREGVRLKDIAAARLKR